MNTDVPLFFSERPAALALYARFEAALLRALPETEIRVHKTQISFRNRYGFAYVSFVPVRRAKDRPRDFITVSFGLAYKKESPRIDQAVEAYPRRWTHHVLIGRPEEIDAELMGWIAEAADFALRKGRGAPPR